MVRHFFVKDRFLIKRAYKKINQFNGIDSIYFILADGSVIFVGSSFTKAPNYQWIPNLDATIYRYGGICASGDGGIFIGCEIEKGLKWEFKCIECEQKKFVFENKLDEFVHDAICKLEDDMKQE